MVVEALLANAAILFGLALIAWVLALQTRNAGFMRALWGAGAAVLALASWLQLAAPGPLATLILVMAAIWGVATMVQELLRGRRQRAGRTMAVSGGSAGLLVNGFLVPSALIFVVASPAQYGILEAGSSEPVSGLALVGFALYFAGLVLGWATDRLPPRLRRRGVSGDWGHVWVWWGIWIAAASAGWWVAAWTVVGPLAAIFLWATRRGMALRHTAS